MALVFMFRRKIHLKYISVCGLRQGLWLFHIHNILSLVLVLFVEKTFVSSLTELEALLRIVTMYVWTLLPSTDLPVRP